VIQEVDYFLVGLQQVSTAARTDLKVHALLRLKMREDAKQVLGRGVALRPEHPHETVGRNGCRLLQSLEAHSGVDIGAQDRAASLLVARRYQFDCFTKQRLAEFWFLLGAFADFSRKSLVSAIVLFPRVFLFGTQQPLVYDD